MKVTWPYKMQAGSQELMAKLLAPNSPFKRIGYGGPKGGGKSFGARAASFTLTYNLPIVVCLVRSRLKVLKQNHIIPAKNELKPFLEAGMLKYYDQDKYFQWKHTDGIVMFKHAESESDVEQFDGIAADLYIFEEASHFTGEMMKGIYKNNRSSDLAISKGAHYPPRTLFTFNWGSKGHSFLRRVFWDKVYEGQERPSDYFFIFAPLDNNKALVKADPNYEQTLKELPEALMRAYLKGDPDAFIGTMFNIVSDVHEVEPEDVLGPYGGIVPPHWELVGSLDSATGGTCSFGMYAITPEGTKYKIYNYYVSKTNPKAHVANICAAIEDPASRLYRYTRGRKPSYIVSDPYAFAKKEQYAIVANDATWEDLFTAKGYFLYKVKYNRITAITALQTALHFEYDGGKLSVDSTLKFFKGECEPTLRELREIERDKNNPEDNAHGPDDKDDAIDETKNFILTAATPPRHIPHIEPEPDYSHYGNRTGRVDKSYGSGNSLESELTGESIDSF